MILGESRCRGGSIPQPTGLVPPRSEEPDLSSISHVASFFPGFGPHDFLATFQPQREDHPARLHDAELGNWMTRRRAFRSRSLSLLTWLLGPQALRICKMQACGLGRTLGVQGWARLFKSSASRAFAPGVSQKPVHMLAPVYDIH